MVSTLAPAATRGAAAPRREAPADHHAWRADIQGLRAVAVLLVVLSHAGVRRLDGGYVGVDVFFVISGFLITSLLARELAATGGISIRRFYARRALRLLPAATLVALVTLGGARLFLSPVRFEEYAGDALASLLQAVNLRLAGAETDYLSEGAPPSPFQHFWSLAVEEQFYLLWPLLLLLGGRAARRSRRGSAARTLPLGALCLVSFALSAWVTVNSASWAYFGSHTRAWELGAGSLLALFAGRLTRLPAAVSAAMTWTGLAAVALAALWFDQDTPFPGYHALLPVLGTVLVLAGGCAPARFGARRLLGARPFTWLGGLSYGWYLWHWPLLVLGPNALDRPASVPLALALSASALLLAWLTLLLVENPVRFHAAFTGRPGRALGLGLGLSAGGTALALTAAVLAPPIPTGGMAPGLRAALATAPDPSARLAVLLAGSGALLPSNLTPPLTEIKDGRSAIYRDGCHVGRETTRVPDSCVYGDPTSETVVVLFGDSHAAQWFPALDRLAREHGWKLVSLTKASCKVPAVTTVKDGEPYAECDAWRENALAAIDALRPSLVIVSSSDAAEPAHPAADPARQWARGYQDTLGRLVDTGGEVAVMLDNPWPKWDGVECAAAYPLELDHCAGQLSGAFRDAERRELTREAARRAGVAVIDPAPWLCSPEGTCPVIVGDTAVYRDESHVNEAYAEAIAPVLGGALSGLVP
ncbi:acyltransferase family protein [Streptomyces litchfieldiae]|uniref:Acyltransferase family protein n=1 Tax=Streptomyces litchfieldiae TaxID=3075543 RepID=A0ABU2MLN4_9ACTN|nr:acyltransferase family protein [Streptomyces sp. DSM 44938]MDT0342445.1 acyltransferase family protein [Streptomyces sp. DSM 44938]